MMLIMLMRVFSSCPRAAYGNPEAPREGSSVCVCGEKGEVCVCVFVPG